MTHDLGLGDDQLQAAGWRRGLYVMTMSFQLPDSRSLSDEVLEALRLRAIRGCELGHSECEVADILGVSRESVCLWYLAFRSGGIDALPQERTGRPRGSGRTLTDEQARHLQDILDNQTPEKVGIAAALWTRPAVRDLIFKEYGIRMAVRTVGSYLARWGYTCKRPCRHAKKQDPEEVANWLEKTYPAIEAKARDEGGKIHWGDETGVVADHHPGRGYARKGEPATMEVPDSHIRINMISTISNEGDLHFMTYKQGMTKELFLVFLERLIASSERKVFLIVDRLPAHMAGMVKDWLATRRDRIEMFPLPRSAPERNADEYLNQDLKANVNKASLPPNQSTLRQNVQSFMRRIGHLKGHIQSYFHHPLMQYAAG